MVWAAYLVGGGGAINGIAAEGGGGGGLCPVFLAFSIVSKNTLNT